MTSTAAQSAQRIAPPTAHPAHRFVALDGLRGVAAIAVVLFHFAGPELAEADTARLPGGRFLLHP